MAGVAGRSGRKVGSRNDTPFRDALRRAVMEADGDEKKLFRIARALVTQAASGDVSAIREVADRLGAVLVAAPGDEGIDLLDEVVVQCNGHPLHVALRLMSRRRG